MGRGLDAATMATVAIGSYRHTRRISIGLFEIYAFMDRAIAGKFGPDRFVTAQMMQLNTATGNVQWVIAGHPVPLLIRGRRIIRRLHSATTLPVGFGGQELRISELALEPGDRVLCFTDGLIEEHETDGEEFGEEQLIDWVDHIARTGTEMRAAVRSLPQALMRERGGITTDGYQSSREGSRPASDRRACIVGHGLSQHRRQGGTAGAVFCSLLTGRRGTSLAEPERAPYVSAFPRHADPAGKSRSSRGGRRVALRRRGCRPLEGGALRWSDR